MKGLRRRDSAYCFGVAGIAKAPWRPTLSQARADAVDAGYAWPDEHPVPPGHDPTIFLHPLAEIWTTHDLAPVLPREGQAAPIAERDAPHLSRIDRIIARREAIR